MWTEFRILWNSDCLFRFAIDDYKILVLLQFYNCIFLKSSGAIVIESAGILTIQSFFVTSLPLRTIRMTQ